MKRSSHIKGELCCNILSSFYPSIYSYFIIYGYVGYFRNYLIENIQLWMWLDINSFIHTLHDVLRYLGTHWHQWWYCLALVNKIHQSLVIQWLLSMFDIDTFIRMVRIVPSSFVAGEDYIIFMTSSAVL